MYEPTPYSELNALLEEFVLQARGILGDDLIGLYLVGSFALGGFDHDSDVDFLCVTRDELTPAQQASIQAMHERLHDLETSWAQHLEGSYISAARLRLEPDGSLLFYLDNGARDLVWSDHCNKFVIRWTLHRHGVALHGPPSNTLLEEVTSESLRLETLGTLRSWLEYIQTDPHSLETRWSQTYAVITHCRMLYTLLKGAVASKPAAVAWALEHLDSSWAGLIERSWADRPNPSLKSSLPASLADAKLTLEFVGYANTLSG
jgi:predicted nucleotidyltransferase